METPCTSVQCELGCAMAFLPPSVTMHSSTLERRNIGMAGLSVREKKEQAIYIYMYINIYIYYIYLY